MNEQNRLRLKIVNNGCSPGPLADRQTAGNKMSKEELMEELMAKLKNKLVKGKDQVHYLR